MWAIRILTGPQTGQIFPLTPGKHRLGRATNCEIKINSNSVSKEHASLLVTEDKLILSDLGSRNGTFVNGVRIQNQRVSMSDKICLHDMILDIVQIPDHFAKNPKPINSLAASRLTNLPLNPPPPAWVGNTAVQLHHDLSHGAQQGQSQHVQLINGQPGDFGQLQTEDASSAQPQVSANSLGDLFYNFKIYLDNVVMPGIYAIAQSMPFRYSLGLLVLAYAVIVTGLSTVPMISVTKNNIRQESVRRAKTIARSLVAMNRQAINDKNDIAISTRAAELEEGVTSAFIVNAKDSTIIAPANKRGELTNNSYIKDALREERESESFVDSSTLVVSVPISGYNSDTGSPSVSAYAIVLYDIGSIAQNSSQTLTLFVQILAIALLASCLLFLFLFKIVENPIDILCQDLDDALRVGRDDLKTDYQFPALERLTSNINSALSRIPLQGSGAMSNGPIINRDLEAANLIRILAVPAMAVNAIDGNIISTNIHFDRLVGGNLNLSGRPISEVPDAALKANFSELLPRLRDAVGEVATSSIPFFGKTFEICGQTVMGTSEPAYYLILFNELEREA